MASRHGVLASSFDDNQLACMTSVMNNIEFNVESVNYFLAQTRNLRPLQLKISSSLLKAFLKACWGAKLLLPLAGRSFKHLKPGCLRPSDLIYPVDFFIINQTLTRPDHIGC